MSPEARTYSPPQTPAGGPEEKMSKSPALKKLTTEKLDFYYGAFQALKGISLDFQENLASDRMAASGCAKSTLIPTLNRMHETVKGTRLTGQILLDGKDIPKEDLNA